MAADCRRDLPVTRWPERRTPVCDAVAEEVAVALSYNGISHVVMMMTPVSYTHLRAHETVLDLVCRLLLEKKKQQSRQYDTRIYRS